MTIDLNFVEQPAALEASPSAVSWAAVIAGALVAVAASLILLTLGSGLGFAAASPWSAAHAPQTVTAAIGIWLIVTQWLASALGGYLTGRLRTRWAGVHTHEVFFRDTAHGLLTWALAAVIVAVLTVWAASSGAAAPDQVLQSGDAARKAASAFAIFSALSMLIGAFVASVAAALGGQQRDLHL